MKYTLQFGLNGNLNGWQEIECEINGQTVTEAQFFINGRCIDNMTFVMISGVGSKFWNFHAKDWGTTEITRDAAEKFAADDLFNVILKEHPNRPNSIYVHPVTEGAFV